MIFFGFCFFFFHWSLDLFGLFRFPTTAQRFTNRSACALLWSDQKWILLTVFTLRCWWLPSFCWRGAFDFSSCCVCLNSAVLDEWNGTTIHRIETRQRYGVIFFHRLAASCFGNMLTTFSDCWLPTVVHCTIKLSIDCVRRRLVFKNRNTSEYKTIDSYVVLHSVFE